MRTAAVDNARAWRIILGSPFGCQMRPLLPVCRCGRLKGVAGREAKVRGSLSELHREEREDVMATTWTPDPTFYPSPKMAMTAPREELAYVAVLQLRRLLEPAGTFTGEKGG